MRLPCLNSAQLTNLSKRLFGLFDHLRYNEFFERGKRERQDEPAVGCLAPKSLN